MFPRHDDRKTHRGSPGTEQPGPGPCSATRSSFAQPPRRRPRHCRPSSSASSPSPQTYPSPSLISKSSAAGSPAATAWPAYPKHPPTPSWSTRSRSLSLRICRKQRRVHYRSQNLSLRVRVVAEMPVPRSGRGGVEGDGRIPRRLGECLPPLSRRAPHLFDVVLRCVGTKLASIYRSVCFCGMVGGRGGGAGMFRRAGREGSGVRAALPHARTWVELSGREYLRLLDIR
jgi:hypothetical protein